MSAFNAPKLNTADTLVALGFWKSLGALAAMASYVSSHLFLWVLYSPFRTASNIAHGVMVTISVKCRSEAVWSIFCDGNSYGCDAGIFIFLRTLHIPITESTDDDSNNAWAGPESILQSTHTIMSHSKDIWRPCGPAHEGKVNVLLPYLLESSFEWSWFICAKEVLRHFTPRLVSMDGDNGRFCVGNTFIYNFTVLGINQSLLIMPRKEEEGNSILYPISTPECHTLTLLGFSSKYKSDWGKLSWLGLKRTAFHEVDSATIQ